MNAQELLDYIRSNWGEPRPKGYALRGKGRIYEGSLQETSPGDFYVYDTPKGDVWVHQDAGGSFAIWDAPTGPTRTEQEARAGERAETRAETATDAAVRAAGTRNDYVRMAIQAANRYDLPAARFVALINEESGFNPSAVNPKSGAAGLAQFMPETARARNVNPLDPEEALDGAAQYLAELVSARGWEGGLLAYVGSSASSAVDASESVRGYVNRITHAENNPQLFEGISRARASAGTERETPALREEREATAALARGRLAQLGQPSSPEAGGHLEAQTRKLDAETAKLYEAMVPKQLQVLQNLYTTVRTVRQQFEDGNISQDEMDSYWDAAQKSADAALRGTTPAAEEKERQQQATQRAQIGRDLINRRVQSGDELAGKMMSDYRQLLMHGPTGAEYTPPPGDYGNPLTYARGLTDYYSGGDQVAELARQLLGAIAPGLQPAAAPASRLGGGLDIGGYAPYLAGGGEYPGETVGPGETVPEANGGGYESPYGGNGDYGNEFTPYNPDEGMY